LAILENLPDEIPEIDYMRRKLEQAKIGELDLLLREAEEAQHRKDLQTAFEFLRRAQVLDSSDSFAFKGY
jgi:hypothetical protein